MTFVQTWLGLDYNVAQIILALLKCHHPPQNPTPLSAFGLRWPDIFGRCLPRSLRRHVTCPRLCNVMGGRL